MKPIFKILGSCLLFAILAVGCADDGEPGPQGEKGDQGDQGEKGDPGSADIYYSEWFDAEFDGIPGSVRGLTVKDENINDQLAENSLILVYGRINNVLHQLPMTLFNRHYYFKVFYSFGELQIIGSSTDGSVQDFDDFTDFRFVIIRGGSVPGGRQADYQSMTYEEIADLFHIHD